MKKLILILMCGFLHAQQTIHVSRVIDGDTFHNQNIRYRIAEIDAPEINQLYGTTSKKYLSNLILDQDVQIYILGKDIYGRQIVRVYLKGQDVAETMIRTGQAWWYSRFSTNLRLKNLHNQAKSRRFGLWKYYSMEPSEYRKLNN